MSIDENHRQANMTLTARKICGVFTTSSNNFGPPTILFHIIAVEGRYTLCSIEDMFFSKKKESRAV